MTSCESDGVKHFLMFSTVPDFYNMAWDAFKGIKPNKCKKSYNSHKEFLRYLEEKFQSLILALYFVDDDDNNDAEKILTMAHKRNVGKLSNSISKKSRSRTLSSDKFDVFGTCKQNTENSTLEEKNSFICDNGINSPIQGLLLDNFRTRTAKSNADDHLDSNKEKIKKVDNKCKICCKLFSTMGSLNRHQKIHTGEMPFKCNICTKQFLRKGKQNMKDLTINQS